MNRDGELGLRTRAKDSRGACKPSGRCLMSMEPADDGDVGGDDGGNG